MRLQFALIVVISLANPYCGFGQSRPDQYLLSKPYLWGKTTSELRIMRNEIFAQYGYVFKSEELSQYFSNQKWYTPLYDNVENFLTDIDKKNIELIQNFEKSEADNFESFVYDSSTAKSITVRSKNGAVFHRQIQVTYPEYNWKMTVERFSFGAEKRPTTVTLEYLNESPYNSNKLPYWRIKKYVDELRVHYDYFQTVVYDIVDNYNEIYPLFRDEPVVRFDGTKCFRFRIPNSSIPHFWIGYSYTAGQESGATAKVYLSDNNGIINELTITSKSGKVGFLEDSDFKVSLSSTRDKLDNVSWNLYELVSSNKAVNRKEVKEFKVVIDGVIKLEIPVVGGYLFGKSERDINVIIE